MKAKGQQAQGNLATRAGKKSQKSASNEKDDSRASSSPHNDSVMSTQDTEDVVQRLHSLEKSLKARETWTYDFEAKVNQEHNTQVVLIDRAKSNIRNKQSAFQKAMLPILAQALDDSKQDIDADMVIDQPIMLRAPQDTSVALEATDILIRCAPSSEKIRAVFSTDRNEVDRAFQAAQILSRNRLRMRLNRGSNDIITQTTMTDAQHTLARKILNKSKRPQDQPSNNSGQGMSTLLHEFGQIMGDLQNLTG